MRKDYMDDDDNNPQIEEDIKSFFEFKGILNSDYSFYIERHMLGDGKHRIVIDYKDKGEKQLDIDSWNGQEFLNEILEDITK